METAQPIASIESFPYSWLVNLRPSLDSSDRASFDTASCDETASFIEMDPTMPPSKRFFSTPQDFTFDFPIPQPPPSALALVHADELFSNGCIAPFFVNPLKMEAYKEVSRSYPTGERLVQHGLIPDSKSNCLVCLRKCRIRLSKRMFLKYLGFLITLCRRIRRLNTSKKVEAVVGVSVVYNEWRKSFDPENSIYEAVLHCKQSIGALNLFSFIIFVSVCEPL